MKKFVIIILDAMHKKVKVVEGMEKCKSIRGREGISTMKAEVYQHEI